MEILAIVGVIAQVLKAAAPIVESASEGKVDLSVADPIIVNTAAQTPEAILAPKTIAPKDLARCAELGQAFAAGLALGVF